MLSRRRRRGKVAIGCFILLLIGFVYGYLTNEPQTLNKPNEGKHTVEKEQPTKNEQENEILKPPVDLELVDEPIPVKENPNTVKDSMKIIFKTYYTQTRDTLTKEESIPVNFVGKPINELEDFFKLNYDGWDIRNLGNDKIELYRVMDQISPKHYIVKEKDGYIAIYQVDDEGKLLFLNQTNIDVSTLSDIDRNKMKEGIIVKGKEAVNQILEDYSS